MKYRMFLVSLTLLILLIAANAYPAVELYDVHSVGMFIFYTLNCTADVTISISPVDASGDPTGPPVRTVTFFGMSKGGHAYMWPGNKDDGTQAAYLP